MIAPNSHCSLIFTGIVPSFCVNSFLGPTVFFRNLSNGIGELELQEHFIEKQPQFHAAIL